MPAVAELFLKMSTFEQKLRVFLAETLPRPRAHHRINFGSASAQRLISEACICCVLLYYRDAEEVDM